MPKVALVSKMDELLGTGPQPFSAKPGELVEGTVVFKGKNKLLIDLSGTATGIISGRELRDSFNTFRALQPGETVTSLVLEEENNEGLVILSLRMASQQKAWSRIHDLMDKDEVMSFIAQEANKGGLLANIDGIRTFLPVSQLAPVHYPRVNNADAGEIIQKLQKFVGQNFTVKVISIDESAGKIVVSEREAMSEQRSRALEDLRVGDVKEGSVSGIVKFGLFVTFEGLEGLVHISEIAWGHVKNPAEYAEVGDRVTVKVIGLDGEKLSLSIKQLTKDPWEEVAERYPVGKRVQGMVVRFTDYGAFVKLEKDINGLVHLSEIAHHKVSDPSDVLTIGQKIEAQVINVDVDERRIGLSIKAILPIDKETLERIKREKEEEEQRQREREEAKKDEASKGEEKTAEEPPTKDTPEKKSVSTQEEVAEEPSTEEAQKKTAQREEAAPAETKKPQEEKEEAPQFVASKSGKKYYPLESSASKKIKEENRVYFQTPKEAEAAGYSA